MLKQITDSNGLPVGQLRHDYSLDLIYVMLKYTQIKGEYYYTIETFELILYKTKNYDCAEIFFDIAWMNNLAYYDNVRALRKWYNTEKKRIASLQCKSKADYKQELIDCVCRRVDGLRPINNGKVTKWVKKEMPSCLI